PHPVLDIRRFFFCPGFGAESGGVLCEPGLLDARQAFAADAAARVRLWDRLGFEPPPHGTTAVSLFGYPNPGLPGLLDSMAAGPRPVRLALAPGLLADAAASWFRAAGRPLPGRLAGQAARAGALEARWLPFLPQPDYDHLLWASDFNFVRGEDSVVRGVWAARPLCWQLYPQDEDAQGPKLEAFIGAVVRHAVDEPGSTPGHSPDGIGPGDPDRSWAALQRAWNGCGVPAAERSRQVAAAWRNAFAELPVLQRRASRFAERLAAWPDLAARLAGFCREQLK
ncbi:MAG: elongation factor P maturation arginine rhamnosyltransferase EarP, partial [Burkholderiales bacterium]|nr:elongation factor P maturation arginine rhamnosyltransferase EarP [Burkholderiales bacterium]